MGQGAERKERGDVAITALYTSWVWHRGKLAGHELVTTRWAWMIWAVVTFALFIARLFVRGARSLEASLLHRHTAIDHLARGSGAPQVLEIASGLSRRGVAFSADPALSYTEVDLPKMTDVKRRLLARTDGGKAVLDRSNFHIVDGDAATLALGPLRDPSQPLVVITEGLCMYLKADDQRGLWTRIERLLRDGAGGTYLFDLVPTVEQPKPGWFGRLLERIMKLFTRGQAFERDERTRDDLLAELKAAGFDHVELVEPGAVAREWGLPRPDTPSQQLLFVCRVEGSP